MNVRISRPMHYAVAMVGVRVMTNPRWRLSWDGWTDKSYLGEHRTMRGLWWRLYRDLDI